MIIEKLDVDFTLSYHDISAKFQLHTLHSTSQTLFNIKGFLESCLRLSFELWKYYDLFCNKPKMEIATSVNACYSCSSWLYYNTPSPGFKSHWPSLIQFQTEDHWKVTRHVFLPCRFSFCPKTKLHKNQMSNPTLFADFSLS